jgi:hypothetical protein
MGVHGSPSAYPSDQVADLAAPVPVPGGGSERWLIPSALVFLLVAVLFGALMLGHVPPTGGGDPAASGLPAPSPAIAGAGAAPALPPSATPVPSLTPSLSPSPAPIIDGLPLRSAASGLCLDVDADPAHEGTPAAQEPCTGGSRQRWLLVATGPGFELVNAASGLCLDVTNQSSDDGAAVQLWRCHGGQNQQWRLQPVSGSVALLVAAHSNKCLDVPAEHLTVPTHLQQWTCQSSTNQQWNAVPS